MRYPSSRLLPSSVQTRQVSFGRDVAGGKNRIEQPFSSQVYSCSVDPTNAVERPEHMREQGVIYYTVKFYSDPQLRIRDEVLYEGKVLVVCGVQGSKAGQQRSWPTHCEYRPPALGI